MIAPRLCVRVGTESYSLARITSIETIVARTFTVHGAKLATLLFARTRAIARQRPGASHSRIVVVGAQRQIRTLPDHADNIAGETGARTCRRATNAVGTEATQTLIGGCADLTAGLQRNA